MHSKDFGRTGRIGVRGTDFAPQPRLRMGGDGLFAGGDLDAILEAEGGRPSCVPTPPAPARPGR